MEFSPTRRDVLAGAATAAVGALAGCNGIPLLGDSNGDVRDWMYEYDDATEDDTSGFFARYQAPSSLAANADQFHPEVREWVTKPSYESGLDPESVEWTVRITDSMLRGPSVTALGGSFDADAARAAATGSKPAEDAEDAGEHDGFSLLAVADGQVGAYRDGLAVQATNTDVDGLESVLDDVDAGDSWPANRPDSFGKTVDALGVHDTLSLNWLLDDDGDVAEIRGSGYEVAGEQTTASLAHWNGLTEDDLEGLAEEIDALSDVSSTEDDDLVTVRGEIDTDRTSLNGAVFQLFGAPYE